MNKQVENLIFIGSKFYSESGTIMSCVYTEAGERFDWGFLEVGLEKGIFYNIRPATKKELDMYEQVLTKLKKKG